MVLDGFESGTLAKWGTFKDASSSVTTGVVSPGQQGSYAMRVSYTIVGGGWGGVEQRYTASQNWSGYASFDFWFNGTASGNPIRVEVLDNQAAGTTTDTAERFAFTFTDSTGGWQRITVPWSSFSRRTDWQPSGAPNDGFNRTQVWGFNFSPLSGSNSFNVDQIQLLK